MATKSILKDLSYPQKLFAVGFELLEEYKGSKAHHRMRCTICGEEHSLTPAAKIRANQLYGTVGCTTCNRDNKHSDSRDANYQALLNKGYEILSEWNGSRYTGAQEHTKVTVRVNSCGHVFTATAINLLSRPKYCGVCG